MAPPPRPDAGRHELVLAILLLVEIAVFARLGHNFFTVGNAMEVLRLSTELGLIAIALTPVIVAGGIDLSVGSMLGLAAVLFGLLTRDAGVGEVPAAVLAVA